jgi:hypothetical protein
MMTRCCSEMLVHWQRGSDLVYEAHELDVGGET